VSPTLLEHAQALLAACLPAWRVQGDVQRAADGAIIVTAADKSIRIAPAPPELPFRWMVSIGERTRGAGSIAGVLRAVRSAVDPDYAPVRLRMAPATIEPP
jgi:hypothetical protein